MGGCSINELSVIQLPIETRNPAIGQYFSKQRLLAWESKKVSHKNVSVVTYRIRAIIWKLSS